VPSMEMALSVCAIVMMHSVTNVSRRLSWSSRHVTGNLQHRVSRGDCSRYSCQEVGDRAAAGGETSRWDVEPAEAGERTARRSSHGDRLSKADGGREKASIIRCLYPILDTVLCGQASYIIKLGHYQEDKSNDNYY
jgi:hypothetical protein